MKARLNLLFCLLFFFSSPAQSDEIDKHAAVNIVQSILQECEANGLLTCESRMRGINVLFDYIRVYRQVIELDKELRKFVAHKYPKAPKLPFAAFKASQRMAINVSLTTEQFSSRIVNARQVPNGYDVIMDTSNGPVLQLRRQNAEWIMIFPPEGLEHFNQLDTLSAAGQLKRSILIYRMLEADLTGLSKQQLEKNINQDLAPLMVKIFGLERFPDLATWQEKEVEEVIAFYQQFSNAKDMQRHIQQHTNTFNSERSSVNAAIPPWAH